MNEGKDSKRVENAYRRECCFSIFFCGCKLLKIFPHFISGTKVDNILDLLLLLLRINRLPYEK